MRPTPLHRTSALSLGALAVAAALALAAPALAVDDDGDKVDDAVDQCVDTPPGDLVDETGCSVCPCDLRADGSEWSSHLEYLACVVDAAKQLRHAKKIGRKTARAAIRASRKSSCGNAQLTRCCIYPDDADQLDTVVGQCRLMTVDDCDALSATHDFVEDADAGSCLPNPCVF